MNDKDNYLNYKWVVIEIIVFRLFIVLLLRFRWLDLMGSVRVDVIGFWW